MGRIPTLLIVASVLLVGTNSFQLGLRTVSSIRNQRLQLSDADQVGSANSSDIINTLSATDAPATEVSESIEAAEVAILSNPLVIKDLDSTSEATESPEIGSKVAAAIASIVPTETVTAPVIIKDLKLAALAPAYPDDTSYMMCSACKAGSIN